jgi:hypothetical protein
MYNYYPQPQQPVRYQMPMQQLIGLKGRPVTSLEEVKAATIDFDGSIFFFPDLANKKIYTKQINLDGTMTLNVYELTFNQPKEESNYVTREEFDAVVKQLKSALGAIPV